MARIYFITGVMDARHEIGKPRHERINERTSQYPDDIDATLSYIKERLENDDFLSITITRDNHNEVKKK